MGGMEKVIYLKGWQFGWQIQSVIFQGLREGKYLEKEADSKETKS